MYITSLQIYGVKLIHQQAISFTRDGEPRMWTVLIGENGLCKTSVLQAIALAASGPDRANQLADVISIPDRRVANPGAAIIADFQFGAAHHRDRVYPPSETFEEPPPLRSSISIPAGWNIFSGFSQYFDADLPKRTLEEYQKSSKEIAYQRPDPLKEARARNLPYWFVAGYGVDRTLPFPKSTERLTDSARERLDSLFSNARIIGTGFADLFAGSDRFNSYNRTLQDALLAHHGMLPRVRTLELLESKGRKDATVLPELHRFGFQVGNRVVDVPATWLSQGYQATIAWIADLIGQMFWESGRAIALDQMEGLVLIDELDLHLHPQWQGGLVHALKSTFPRVQFVATTHSPMILPALEQDEIFHVGLDEKGNVQVTMADQSPKLMTGSEIYDSFFGIDRLYPEPVGEALNRFGYLASDPHRSDEEEKELQRLMAKLKAEQVEPGWEPVPRNGKKSSSSKPSSRRRKRR